MKQTRKRSLTPITSSTSTQLTNSLQNERNVYWILKMIKDQKMFADLDWVPLCREYPELALMGGSDPKKRELLVRELAQGISKIVSYWNRIKFDRQLLRYVCRTEQRGLQALARWIVESKGKHNVKWMDLLPRAMEILGNEDETWLAVSRNPTPLPKFDEVEVYSSESDEIPSLSPAPRPRVAMNLGGGILPHPPTPIFADFSESKQRELFEQVIRFSTAEFGDHRMVYEDDYKHLKCSIRQDGKRAWVVVEAPVLPNDALELMKSMRSLEAKEFSAPTVPITYDSRLLQPSEDGSERSVNSLRRGSSSALIRLLRLAQKWAKVEGVGNYGTAFVVDSKLCARFLQVTLPELRNTLQRDTSEFPVESNDFVRLHAALPDVAKHLCDPNPSADVTLIRYGQIAVSILQTSKEEADRWL